MARIVATADQRNVTESQLLEFVRAAAKQLGWRFYHTRNSFGSTAGFPDLVMVRGQRVIYAELKAARGRLSPAQVEWLTELRAVAPGGVGRDVYLWQPRHMDAIVHVLAGRWQHAERCPDDPESPIACNECGRWRLS